ncbi:MAG: Transcriptional regulator, TetR family [Desulfacinum sp.]|nr:Transcriptional regulator, TetR family [Desulfacinum sp.]
MTASAPPRSRLSAEERRRKILEAAIRLFSQKGFQGTTVRDLARQAGVSEAMLYQHFPSKEALYHAILERKVEEMRSAWDLDWGTLGDVPTVLRRVVRSFLQRHASDPAFVRIVLFSALEGHELARDFVRGPRARFLELLSSYLKKGMNEGTVRDLDGDVAARLLIGMAHYVVLLREVFGEGFTKGLDLEDLSDAIADVFWRGIRGEDPEGRE